MQAKELMQFAPYGARIKVSDGKARPPARFSRKVREWERSNFSGLFVYTNSKDEYFTLQTVDLPHVVINTICRADSAEDFQIMAQPAEGTILAWREFVGSMEVQHVFSDVHAALSWGKERRYDLSKCGLQYKIVTADGWLKDYAFTPVAA